MPPESPEEKTNNLNPMIENKNETSTAGSDRIPQRRTGEGFGNTLHGEVRQTAGLQSVGVAGPSREVSKRDSVSSGAAYPGRDDDELRWAQKHVPDNAADHRPKGSVFRKTELHNASQGSPAEETAKVRKRIRRNLDNPGSGVTLRPFETAVRDLVCSIIGQQDLAEEKLFLHIADLQQQITDLQQTIATLEERMPVQAPPPSATEKPEGYV